MTVAHTEKSKQKQTKQQLQLANQINCINLENWLNQINIKLCILMCSCVKTCHATLIEACLRIKVAIQID